MIFQLFENFVGFKQAYCYYQLTTCDNILPNIQNP